MPHQSGQARYISTTLPRPIAMAPLLTQSLTARELAAFELLGLGYDNRSISRMLSISERTTKRYITGILTKLNLESRLQAGLAALVCNLATQPDPTQPATPVR